MPKHHIASDQRHTHDNPKAKAKAEGDMRKRALNPWFYLGVASALIVLALAVAMVIRAA